MELNNIITGRIYFTVLFFIAELSYGQSYFTPLQNKNNSFLYLSGCFYDSFYRGENIKIFQKNSQDCIDLHKKLSFIKFRANSLKKDYYLLNEINDLYIDYLNDQGKPFNTVDDSLASTKIIYSSSPNLIATSYVRRLGKCITDIAIFINPTIRMERKANKNKIGLEYLFCHYIDRYMWWYMICPLVVLCDDEEVLIVSGSVKDNYFMNNVRK